MAGENQTGVGDTGGQNQVTPWFTGKADAELTGYLQTKGWDKLDPASAAIEAAKSHRESERFIGIPQDERLRLPKDPKDAAWNGVWTRLGVPNEPKDYDLSGVKFADGQELDQGFADFLRTEAHKRHISKADLPDFAKSLVSQMEAADSAQLAEKTATLAGQKAELQKNWGKNYEANLFVAKQAAGKLGMTPEQVTALETTIGYHGVMEMLRKVGAGMGEDRFVSGGTTGAPGVMTREQAIDKVSQLKADRAWGKRYIDGGVNEQAEMRALLTLIHGDDTQESINSGKFTAGRF